MDAIAESLQHELAQPEFSEGYAESFLDAYVATQIKVLREQNTWTQEYLARKIGTKQTVISRIENINYSAWSIKTLKKLARAFRLRLHVSFETCGSLLGEMDRFSREGLQRIPREDDSELIHAAIPDLKDLRDEKALFELIVKEAVASSNAAPDLDPFGVHEDDVMVIEQARQKAGQKDNREPLIQVMMGSRAV